MENFPVAQLYLFLLFETFILIGLWIKVAFNEIQMLQDFFSDSILPLPKNIFFVAIGIAFLCGVLSYFSYDIIIYSSIFICMKLFLLWGIKIRNTTLRSVFKRLIKNEINTNNERKNELNIMERYYLQKPQFHFEVTILYISIISLLLGLLGKLCSKYANLLLSITYIIMLLNIAFDEKIYIKWRNERDKALGESYS